MSEIEKLLTMNYENVCNFLKNKYGCVSKNYFSDATMTKKSQGITRGKEGFYFHHIDENKTILLSTSQMSSKVTISLSVCWSISLLQFIRTFAFAY